MRLAKTATAALALLLLAAAPVKAQTTFFVDVDTGTDVLTCGTTVVTPCASIQYTIDFRASAGDLIVVDDGVYPEFVEIDKPLTVRGEKFLSTGWAVGRGAGESRIVPPVIVAAPPADRAAAVVISASNVTFRGFEIDGSVNQSTWAGVQVTGAAVTNVSVVNNRILGIERAEPVAAPTYNYSYGIHTLGAGTPGNRSSIANLSITGNLVQDIGDGTVPFDESTGGIGMHLASVNGATVSNNRIDTMLDGSPSPASASLGAAFEYGICVALVQDDDSDSGDTGINTSGTACDNAQVGVLAQTENSLVAESYQAFPNGLGSVTGPMVVNLSFAAVGDYPLATVDPTNLAPFFVSTDLLPAGLLDAPDVIGYFDDIQSLYDGVQSGGTVSAQPSDGTIDGTTVTLFSSAPDVIRYTFPNLEVIDLNLSIPVPPPGFTLVPSLYGTNGDEAVSIDADLLTIGDFMVDLGAGFDSMTILNGAVPFTTITHVAVDEHTGTYTYAPGFDLSYFGLDPIFDNVVAANRIFNFTAADDSVTLGDDDTVDNNVSRIDSDTSERIDFVNPTATLVINGLNGNDTIYTYPMGTDLLGFIPAIAVTVNGGLGRDHFHIFPLANPGDGNYASIQYNGGAPAVCPGDELHVDSSFEPVTVGASPWTVPGYFPFSYTGIEAFPNAYADLEIEATPVLYPGDLAAYTVTVTNNGPSAAQCIVVENVLPADLILQSPVTLSAGALDPSPTIGPDWLISSLAAPTPVDTFFATLNATVFVNTFLPTVSTVDSGTTDSVTVNNSAQIIGEAFKFPAPTVAQKALVYRYTVDDGINGPEEFERLIVGLYQGAPSLTGAVICQIPRPVAGSPYYTVPDAFVANRWRQCSEGLPYPLHPNDLMQDSNGRIWLATWGHAGLYYSDNGGLTWTASEPNLANVPQGWVNIFAIEEDINGFLYISANDGKVFFSLDGGTNWTLGGSLPWVDADTPWSLVADPDTEGTIYAGTFGRGVFVTNDFTQTWEPLGGTLVNDDLVLMSGGHIFDLEFSPDNPDVLFAATGLGVFKIDLGMPQNLWTWVDTGLRINPGDPVGPEARSLAFDLDDTVLDGDPVDSDDDLYVATWGSGVYRLEDPIGGMGSWQFFQLRGQEITFVAPGVGGGIIVGTANGGLYQFAAAISTANEAEPGAEVPDEFVLAQNYPNPFNPVTTIDFSMPETGHARLVVFDVLGREVQVLFDGQAFAGRQSVTFDASSLPSGTYIYRLSTERATATRQMVLLK